MLPSPCLGLGLRLLLYAVAVVSLTAVATSTDTSNPFTWLDCPSPASAPSPSSLASPTMNTTFQSNVIALLDALPTAAAPTGFASLSRGDGTDCAFVRGLCRGDSTPENCTRYLQKAVHTSKNTATATAVRRSGTTSTTSSMDKIALSSSEADSVPISGITVEKSVEFSYTELFDATEGFSMSNKIGQGGFGVVYYADLRGMKAANKKMDMQATHEFLAELKVLTHVHHLNLVRIIGYCIESSLFIVYEYIDNGNLSQHLRGTGGNVSPLRLAVVYIYTYLLGASCKLISIHINIGYEPLSWARRVQIALDSARGLEYIHEHTVPVYIQRDVKSANILIDKNYWAKVRIVHGYGQYGDVFPKVDVYAFGVVIYELISAKEAIMRSAESCSDSKGLIYLFEDALSTPDRKEGLQRLLDPTLGEDCPIDSVLEMTVLARACTQLDPKSRPTMRSVVVALMTLIVKMSDRVL
ncbi:hypothetical protein HU200_033703 [Digitaria exilis]|uniref:Protein kinase domain-containing protein n=1 Tax=Digitaria exilis TaxID=1010633 RepID=A0A835BRG4_9POAL|nr:hypothetical protein HU200_033703 [Digitaria exilis]